MPQPKKGYVLGSGPDHQQRMLRNLARSLFEHERVRTTEAKARLLRPFAERLITKAKKGSVHHRRQALATIEDRDVVQKLFTDIGPRFADRPGGYTRVLKLGTRNGDGAPMALIELVDEGIAPGEASAEERGRRRGRRRRGAQDKPARSRAAEAAAEGEAASEEAGGEEPAAEGPLSQEQAEEAAAERPGVKSSTEKQEKP